jgi:hypothetical protein
VVPKATVASEANSKASACTYCTCSSKQYNHDEPAEIFNVPTPVQSQHLTLLYHKEIELDSWGPDAANPVIIIVRTSNDYMTG